MKANQVSNSMGYKRLFFGLEVRAPWTDFPKGRIIEEDDRHLTIAFLGNADYDRLLEILNEFPYPSFNIGFTGILDKFLFLPPHHPHVVAFHAKWFAGFEQIFDFRKKLILWLNQHQLQTKEHEEFLPHVSICRRPFNLLEWKKKFSPIPFIANDIHLYESLGHSNYKKVWTYAIKPPFEEIDHTADVGFIIRGKDLFQIHRHAQCALAFLYPKILDFLSNEVFHTLDDIIIDLNTSVSRLDAEIGSPFKAVSFHGKLIEDEGQLCWEMIIDV